MSPASIASLETALSTFEDILIEGMVTFLTHMRPPDISPPQMVTIIVPYEVLCSPCNQRLPQRILNWQPAHIPIVTIYHLIRAIQKLMLIPPLTCAILPALSANVAELSSANTTGK